MKNRVIILFLAKFIGLYLVLNTMYGFWIESYRPAADPLTRVVTVQSVWLISLFEEDISIGTKPGPNIPVVQADRVIIEVFEGCNGLNVMIVFLCFVVAFSGTLKKTTIFCIAGILVIYLMNLFRVSMLFFVSKYYHEALYFFHKYAFTGGLYAAVFVMWYLWVQRFRDAGKRTV
jgi:exosortase family protein XrtF